MDDSSVAIQLIWAAIGGVFGGILSPAFGFFGDREGDRTLEQVLREAQEISGAPNSVRMGWVDRFLAKTSFRGFALALVFVTLLYVRYRIQVILALPTLSLLVLCVANTVVMIAWRRRVIGGSVGTMISALWPTLVTCAGVWDAYMLAMGQGASADARLVLGSCSLESSHITLSGFMFILYEALGALLFAFVALLSIWMNLYRIAAIYVVEYSRPRWLWRRACRYGMAWSGFWVLVFEAFIVAASLAFASGALFGLVERFSSSSL